MNQYEFCADWAARYLPAGGLVLDYGCGAGQIVGLLRQKRIDAYGCDVFYEGGDYSTDIPAELRGRIQRMSADRIPFPDCHFDVVLSNQVFEHVPDMDLALGEVARVLKPGGVALNLFPDHGVWREGHCGVPFLHWFPKGSHFRVYYAAVAGSLGLGTHKDGKTAMQWARDFCTWLDNWTYYRKLSDIDAHFSERIGATRHVEQEWLTGRLGQRFEMLPNALQRFMVRKMAGVALVSTKQT